MVRAAEHETGAAMIDDATGIAFSIASVIVFAFIARSTIIIMRDLGVQPPFARTGRRIICLFAGHEFTTIAWGFRSKVWSQKECLRCGKRVKRGKGWTPPKAPPPPPPQPEQGFRL